MKLLHVDSSILGVGSVSRILSADIVAAERKLHPGIEVTYLDLAATPIDHLAAHHIGAAPIEGGAREADVAAGHKALADFLAADIVVVGSPMYNFGVSSQLKAWIDRLSIAGQTFRYNDQGQVEGLAGGKTVIVASSRGGFYGEGQPIAFMDHQETYLRGIFGFFGITDVTFIRAEGIAVGPEFRAKGIEAAKAEIAKRVEAKLAA